MDAAILYERNQLWFTDWEALNMILKGPSYEEQCTPTTYKGYFT